MSVNKERLYACNKVAAKFYIDQLWSKQGELGLQYFTKRGLTRDTLIKFGLGYSGNNNNVCKKLLSEHFTEEEIINSGIAYLTEWGLSDRFKNRVIFPIIDELGRIVGFGGRVLGTGEPKYLNSPETPIYEKKRNLFGIRQIDKTQNKIILCEGYMDVISLHQYGQNTAVASLGTALTDDQCKIIRNITNKVYIATDSDKPGTKAALKAVLLLNKHQIDVKRINWSPYKDPDELAKKEGEKGIVRHIEQAIPSLDFEVQASGEFIQSEENKRQFQRAVFRQMEEMVE